MSGALALAALLAGMQRPALERLVSRRRVNSPSSISEPLGLAIDLLRSESIARALQFCHRDQLDALESLQNGKAQEPAILEALAADALVGIDADASSKNGSPVYVSLPEVAAAIPREIFLATPPEITDFTAPEDLSGWYVAAITSVRRVAKMLRTIGRRPVRLGRKGFPTVVAVREVAESAHCSQDEASHLLEVMRSAGLLHAFFDHTRTEFLGVSPGPAEQWLMHADYSERWIALAHATTSWFDARLLRALSESGGNLGALRTRVPFDYPLLPEADRERLTRVIETASEVGLVSSGWVTAPTRHLLEDDVAGALALARVDMPANVTGVYVQPDLSIIVPGPLPAQDEAMLSAITETEQLGPAASLRIHPERLEHAVARAQAGSAEIRAALERLSLTGIPQPLDYLLRDLDRKASALSEGPAAGTVSELHATDPTQASELPPTSAPLLAKTSNDQSPTSATSATSATRQLDIADMIDRVLAATVDAGDEGDLTRRLELAIRNKHAIRVTAVAGKDQREFTLLPVSLKAGRLRATDQVAGVERTLPVSAITQVATVAA